MVKSQHILACAHKFLGWVTKPDRLSEEWLQPLLAVYVISEKCVCAKRTIVWEELSLFWFEVRMFYKASMIQWSILFA